MPNDGTSNIEEQRPWGQRPGPSLFFGLLIVFVGTVLLLERLGYVDSDLIFRFWPLALSALGLSKLVSSQQSSGRFWGAILMVAGLGIFLSHEGHIRIDGNLLWPLALILLGVHLAYRSLWGSRQRSGDGASAEAVLNEWAVFGGGRLVSTSADFQGGELFAMFGGYEADLTKARLGKRSVEINATAIFGGVELHVPNGWDVVNKGIPIFGGYEDKRIGSPETDQKPEGQLIIRGFAIFGGVEINGKGA